MSDHDFKSRLGNTMEAFIREQEDCGFSTTLTIDILKNFDRFIIEVGFDDGTLSEGLVTLWTFQRKSEKLNTRNDRVKIIRNLARYIISCGDIAYIAPYGASEEYIKPYVPSRSEVSVLFKTIDSVSISLPYLKRFEIEYPLMFRLYYCEGMRLNEAVVLERDDVDLKAGTIYIRHSKGDKDRRIHVTPDLLDLLRRYDSKMDSQYIPDRQWFFPGFFKDRPFNKTTLCNKMQEFWGEAFPDRPEGQKTATIHSLRHAFVVHRINDWLAEGNDIDNLIAYLSKHLGHSGVQETMYYYHSLASEIGIVGSFLETPKALIEEVTQWL